MKKYFIVLITFFITSFGCSSEQIKSSLTNSSSSEAFIVDVGNAKESNEALEKMLVDKMEVVTFETRPESYLREITKVIFAKGRFYVYDSRLINLLVFDRSGKFLFRIGERGNGPGEYVDIVDFTIDESNDLIGLLSIQTRQIHFFGLDGVFKASQKLDFQASRLVSLEEGKLAFFLAYFDETFKNFKMTNSKGKVIYEHFDIPQDIFPMGLYAITGQMTKNNDGVMYSDATSSIIHQISENGTTYPKYQFEIGTNAWPEADKFLFKKFFDNIQKGKVSYLTNRYRESNDFLVASVNKSVPEGSRIIVDFNIVLYDKKQNNTYLLSDIISKSMSGPIGYNSNLGFISSIKNDDLKNIMGTDIGKRVIGLNQEIEVDELNSEENPSIILYSFIN